MHSDFVESNKLSSQKVVCTKTTMSETSSTDSNGVLKAPPQFQPLEATASWIESFNAGFVGNIVAVMTITQSIGGTKNQDGTMVGASFCF